MTIKRKTEQVLTYLELAEREELDVAVAETDLSRAGFVREAVLDKLEKRRQGIELLHSVGDFDIVTQAGEVVRRGEDVVSLG